MHFRYRMAATGFINPTTGRGGDDDVDIDDLAALLTAWGDCIGCDEDLSSDDVVDTTDLFIVLATWGDCP